eukprot:scaffold26186_cov30-Tisochrysis_lutea.AAC.6
MAFHLHLAAPLACMLGQRVFQRSSAAMRAFPIQGARYTESTLLVHHQVGTSRSSCSVHRRLARGHEE